MEIVVMPARGEGAPGNGFLVADRETGTAAVVFPEHLLPAGAELEGALEHLPALVLIRELVSAHDLKVRWLLSTKADQRFFTAAAALRRWFICAQTAAVAAPRAEAGMLADRQLATGERICLGARCGRVTCAGSEPVFLFDQFLLARSSLAADNPAISRCGARACAIEGLYRLPPGTSAEATSGGLRAARV